MDNPIELKPLEPQDLPKIDFVKPTEASEKPVKKHKGITLGKLITISTGVILIALVVGVVIYSQSGQRYKGAFVTGDSGDSKSTPFVQKPAGLDITVNQDILKSSGGTTDTTTGTVSPVVVEQGAGTVSPEIAKVAGQIGTTQPDTSTDGTQVAPGGEVVSPEAVSPTVSDAVKEGLAINPEAAKTTSDGIYRDDSEYIPLAPATDIIAPKDALQIAPGTAGPLVAPAVDPALKERLDQTLDVFTTVCDQYKAELDYAYYHDDWIGTEKSYAVSLAALKGMNCLSDCDYAFYDGLFQLHSESYMLDSSYDLNNPAARPVGANASIINLLAACTDKCDKIFDMYAFFVKYAKSQSFYSVADKEMMHHLIDKNITTCNQCVELENPVFNESKYFTREFESLLDSIRTTYGDLYYKATVDVNLKDIPYELPPEQLGPQVSIPVAYAASGTSKSGTGTDAGDAEFVTASTSVLNDIKTYLQGKCLEPAATAQCTEVHFVDPAVNPPIPLNSFNTVYNQKIDNEPLLVQATGVSGNVRYEFSTDTPINPLFQFADTVNTGNPLITSSPRVNLSTNEIVSTIDAINVRVIDANNNLVGSCTDQIVLTFPDRAEETVDGGTTQLSSDIISGGSTSDGGTSGGGTSGGGTTGGGTTGGGTSGGGTTGGGSGSGSASGVAGGTLPRCNSLEIIKPITASAAGTPTVNVSENGYVNENLTINVNTSSGVVSKYRFKSLNGTISFNNQGTTVDVPATTKTVRMNGGPNAGQEDTITVWALNSSNNGIQSCHDAFIVSVPVAQVAGAPVVTKPTEGSTVLPATHPASPSTPSTPSEPQQPAPMPIVHKGAETPLSVAAAPTPEGTMPPTTPDDGPGVLVYFIGAGLGGLIFSRKKKNK